MQLASRPPLLRTGCCWLSNFFGKAYWATPFKMHFDFRPLLCKTFRELSRKLHYPQAQPSAGGASEEKQTPGALVFGPRRASLLEAWLLHLELVSWDFRKQRYQYQRQVQGSASRPCCLAVAKPHPRKLGCYLWREKQMCGTILLPDPRAARAAGVGSP